MCAGESVLLTADLSRVAVVGTSCSGKSTFARALADTLVTSYVELDAFYWLPNWRPRDRAELRALTANAVAQPRWVLDGNYGSMRNLIWPWATAVIWLNYAFAIVGWRSLRRTLHRCASKESPFPGNRESFARAFLSRDSILLRVIGSYPQRQQQYRAALDGADYPHLTRIEIRHPRAAESALQALEAARGCPPGHPGTQARLSAAEPGG